MDWTIQYDDERLAAYMDDVEEALDKSSQYVPPPPDFTVQLVPLSDFPLHTMQKTRRQREQLASYARKTEGRMGFWVGNATVKLFLSPDPERVDSASVQGTTAHEYMHAARYDQDGSPSTVLDTLIGEGLSLHFEEAVTGERPRPVTRPEPFNEEKAWDKIWDALHEDADRIEPVLSVFHTHPYPRTTRYKTAYKFFDAVKQEEASWQERIEHPAAEYDARLGLPLQY